MAALSLERASLEGDFPQASGVNSIGPMEDLSSATNRNSPKVDAKDSVMEANSPKLDVKVLVMEAKDVNDSIVVRNPASKVFERGSTAQKKTESLSAVV